MLEYFFALELTNFTTELASFKIDNSKKLYKNIENDINSFRFLLL